MKELTWRLVCVLVVTSAALWSGWTFETVVLIEEIDWQACFANAANAAAGLPADMRRVVDIDPVGLRLMIAAERAKHGATDLFLTTALIGFAPLIIASGLARTKERAAAYATVGVGLALLANLTFDWPHACDEDRTAGDLAALNASVLLGAASVALVVLTRIGLRLAGRRRTV